MQNRKAVLGRGLTLALALWLVLMAAGSCAAPGGPAKVSFNEDNVLIINGKKVFPIGFSDGPPLNSKTPEGRNGYEELRRGGGLFLRTGVRGNYDEDAIDPKIWQREKVIMDTAARYGMFCWTNLHQLSSLEEGSREKEAMLRQVVNRFKDHPGHLVWKNVDEAQWAGNPVEPMVRAYKLIKELDPYHPVGLTQAPRGTVQELQPYNAAADLLLLDIYPISYPPGKHSLLANKEISMVGDWTRFIKEAADGKPIWMVLQICWTGVTEPGKTLRFPTFAQERFMTYQAIINGARGLIFRGGNLERSLNPEDAVLGWNWTYWKKILRPLLEEINENSPLAEVMIAPDSKLPIAVNDPNSEIEFCVREVGEDLYILACKREGATIQVEFRNLPDWAGEGEVLYESPRTVKAEAGKFTDWFAPFDVHVYHFRP